MTTFFLLAHHMEARHVAIAAVLFASGTFAGWAGMGRWRDSTPRNQRLS